MKREEMMPRETYTLVADANTIRRAVDSAIGENLTGTRARVTSKSPAMEQFAVWTSRPGRRRDH
jgi:hypothetical protein